jgi:3-oxoacyl-[acyl-carrier-protein] synthase II
MNRVVVTGMSAITPIGSDWAGVRSNLVSLQTGVKYMSDWDIYDGLNTKLAAPVLDFEKPEHYTRKLIRSMGRGSIMATRVTELALEQAGLLDDESIQDGSMGVSYGSSSGSPDALADFTSMYTSNNTSGLTASSYIKMMSHTAPVNLAIFFKLKGRVHTTSSACTSGSQGIGYAFEAIKYGQQAMMVSGGSEELCAPQAAVFDTLYATSTKNESPSQTPSPFDADRDGLVIGEGAATLVLESLDHANARGANIIAELVGYGTNCDGTHITQPSSDTMRVAMEMALRDANISHEAIGYISAHGTATDRGDIAESKASYEVFADKVPISALKSFTGHTLGACGGIEAWASIEMMNEGWFHATANLNNVDPECGDLDYIQKEARQLDCEYVMTNNFAFGGINTSLIFRRWS